MPKGWRFNSWQEQEIFLFPKPSISALGHTQPPIWCIPRTLFLGLETDCLPPFCAKIVNSWGCTSTPPCVFMAWSLLSTGTLYLGIWDSRNCLDLLKLFYWSQNPSSDFCFSVVVCWNKYVQCTVDYLRLWWGGSAWLIEKLGWAITYALLICEQRKAVIYYIAHTYLADAYCLHKYSWFLFISRILLEHFVLNHINFPPLFLVIRNLQSCKENPQNRQFVHK